MSNDFLENWQVQKIEAVDITEKNYNSADWENIRIPHDYAIYSGFDKNNDAYAGIIKADGINKPIPQYGRTGGLPIGQPVWYRKEFFIQETTKRAFIEFDGIMSNSTVYVNGNEAGGRPYGYSSFSVEITKYMKPGKNILYVKTAQLDNSSRWYPGGGIYREARLIENVSDTIISYNGIEIISSHADNVGTLNCKVALENYKDTTVNIQVFYKGAQVAEKKNIAGSREVKAIITIPDVKIWDTASPNLYLVKIDVLQDNEIVESKKVKIGVRNIEYKVKEGFYLNGRLVKFKGVCMHHDLGPLGSAFNKSAAKRQLKKLMEMGANAIRTSHNPPAPQLLDLCDELGLLVLDEAFDCWEKGKTTHDYNVYFKDWWKRDITDLVKRDINHPSIVMWSIGNEIMEQGKLIKGYKISKMLTEAVKNADPLSNRVVTVGMNSPKGGYTSRFHKNVDVMGCNYNHDAYKNLIKKCKKSLFLATETSSCVSSRGEYFLPAALEIPAKKKENLHCTSYDLAAPGWGCLPEKQFEMLKEYTEFMGEFVWTGFDYLGEPTPYYEEWPSRSSYFGIFDLCGLRKDRFYIYQAEWTKEDVLHIVPSNWNFQKGQKVTVQCYTSFDKVELFLNNKSLGIKEKAKCPADETNKDYLKKYRLIWENVPFEEGELKAVAVNKPSVTDVVKTAGKPYRLKITPEQSETKADTRELSFFRVDVLDESGVICPKADNKINISVAGNGTYICSDNGNPLDTRTFNLPYCQAFNGSMVIYAGNNGKSGDLIVNVTSENLVGDTAVIQIKD